MLPWERKTYSFFAEQQQACMATVQPLWSAEKEQEVLLCLLQASISDLYTCCQVYPYACPCFTTTTARCYSQGWGCDDDVRVVTWGPGQWGGRKTTFAAGSQWPAWSSAGPATHTHHLFISVLHKLTAGVYNWLHVKTSLSINLSPVCSQCKVSSV